MMLVGALLQLVTNNPMKIVPHHEHSMKTSIESHEKHCENKNVKVTSDWRI